MTIANAWPAGWYPVEGYPDIQREWNGTHWTGVTRPTKRFLGIVMGGDPKKAGEAAQQFYGHIHRLHSALIVRRRGEARVAWNSAYSVLDAAFGPDSPYKWNESLNSIGFDPAFVQSHEIGTLDTLDGGPFEVFEDFVTYNEYALDTNRFTTISVFQDGQIQVTVNNVTDRKGRSRMVEQTHDLRTAAIQVSGPEGAIRANIHPDLGGYAHQVAQHFNARMQSLAPSAVTAADLQTIIDTALASTGQSAAEKLQELDRLRYHRLLSDDDWARAKDRILGSV